MASKLLLSSQKNLKSMLLNMSLGDTLATKPCLIRRVVGGWIYEYPSKEGVIPCFIRYDNTDGEVSDYQGRNTFLD